MTAPRTVEQIMADTRWLSDDARARIIAVATEPHDWALRWSNEDRLIEALTGLADLDLDAVRCFAQHLEAAATCVQIREYGFKPMADGAS